MKAQRNIGLVHATEEGPRNSAVRATLTDMYQITMAYTYWRTKRSDEHAVFDMFFRKSPFGGEYTVFAGLEEVLRFVQTYSFRPDEVEYLRQVMPDSDPGFFDYLAGLDCSKVLIYGAAEGTVMFPRVPVLRIEGPLGVCQLLETTLLNICNFASLMATNAARFRLVAGESATLLEFGLRRAQGPDGAMSATRYALIGGFNSSSNVAACKEAGVTPVGSQAHALVSSFVSMDDLPLSCSFINGVNIAEVALKYRSELGYTRASSGELAAFISFATSFPAKFTALVDTYDTLSSGVPNYICVALAMADAGAKAYGIRLDSGDLAYLSKEARRLMKEADAKYGSMLASSVIVASNDINEAVLLSLHDQGHEINSFGIGTHLVTCQAQPALGMVYKLVEVRGAPRIKLSNETTKVTLPGAKEVFRLLGSEGVPLLDYILRSGEARPVPGKRLLARHPFDEKKRAYVTPTAVIPLLRLVWKGHAAAAPAIAAMARAGAVTVVGDAPVSQMAEEAAAAAHMAPPGVNLRAPFPPVQDLQAFVRHQLALLREDVTRPLNPTPYKVSVSPELFHFLHDMWMKEVPIHELE